MKKLIFIALLLVPVLAGAQTTNVAQVIARQLLRVGSDTSKYFTSITQTISAASTHRQAPTAKAVWDLATRSVVDTVNDYTALRAYANDAPIVFVKKAGIQGFFKRMTSGSWADDGGITIVGTYKFRRIAENLSRVNVRWFGAVGDSTTNDNTAIQAAVAFCKDSSNATLYFPAGKYRYTASIVFYKPFNLSIHGDGMHNTYLFPVNVTGIYVRTDSTSIIYYGEYGPKEAREFQIKDLTMIRVGSNTFSGKIYGLDLRGGFNKRLENLVIRNYFASSGTGVGSVGIRLWQPFGSDAVQHTIFDNVFVGSCDTGIVSRQQNTMQWRGVKIDACKKFGLVLSNSLTWNGGMCQGNENCGIYLKNSDPSVLNEVTINGVHFEANAYVAPKWGGIYKPDNTDMTDLSIKNCLLSSPGNTHMLRLKRVQHSEIVNNRYSGSATTDTISLTSFYDVLYGNDNYTSLKLITSDAYITWLNGTNASVGDLTGLSLSTATAGHNSLNVGGGIAIGSTYATTNTAPTDGALIQGNVGIKNTSPTQPLHVTGNARVTGAIYDSNNDPGSSGQVLSSTVTGTDWITPSTGGSSTDSTWAKTAGGYANKRITDPIYRSSSARINMTGDSAALTLKYASTQTNPILKIQYNNGTTAAIAHVYNSTNPSLVMGGTPSVNSASANNTIFGLTTPTFTSGAGQNSFFGRSAGNACNGCYENTFLGSSAGTSITNGFQNSFIGYLAGQNNTTGYQNMFLGRRAGQTNVSGQNNVYVGSDAGRLGTGSGNVFIGGQAGDQNTGSTSVLLGFGAGRTNTGSGNVFVGSSAGELTSGSNMLMLDNSNTSTPLVAGDFSANRFGINTAPGSLARDLHVTGEARITDLTTDPPTRIVGADADGDLGQITLSNELSLSSSVLGTNFGTTISPSQLTAGMTNNWNPTGLATAWIIRIDGDGKFELITGITAPSYNKRLVLCNIGTNSILLPTENQSSSAANRFAFARDVIIFPGKTAEIVYDVTSSRWRLLSQGGLYDNVQDLYFNEQFNAPVSGTSGDWSFFDVVSAGSISTTAPVAGRWGGIDVNTGSSATGAGYVASKDVYFNNNNTSGTATWAYAKAVIKTPANLSDASNDYTIRVGFTVSPAGGTGVDGMYIDYNHAVHSGNWSCATTNAGNTQRNNSGVTVATSTVYTLEVVFRTNLSVEFFINGSRVATNDTFIPTGSNLYLTSEIEKSVGTAQRDISVYTLQTSIALVK